MNYISIIVYLPCVVVIHHLYFEKYKFCCCCKSSTGDISDVQQDEGEHVARDNFVVRFYSGPYFRFVKAQSSVSSKYPICLNVNVKKVFQCCHNWLSNEFFFLILEDISPFCVATHTLVLDFWWHLPWVSKPGWICCILSLLCDPQIHFWWNTCWLCGGQHGSQAFYPHICTSKSTNNGGGLGLKSMTFCAVSTAL